MRPSVLRCTVLLAAWLSAPALAQSLGDTALLRSAEVVVTRADIDAKLAPATPEVRFGVVTSRKRLLKLIDNVLVHRVLAQEARDAGLEQSEIVRRQVQLAVEEALAKARVAQLTEQAKATAPTFVPLAREIYDANIDRYSIPEGVEVSHILIGTADRTSQQAADRADEIYRMAEQGARPFAELAEEFSDDPTTAARGGELRLIQGGQTPKAVKDAALALPAPGAISRPVRTPAGYHIVRLDERRPARQQTFDEVKGSLVDRLKKDYVEGAVNEHIGAIRTKRPLDLDEAALGDLKQALPPVGGGHDSQTSAGG